MGAAIVLLFFTSFSLLLSSYMYISAGAVVNFIVFEYFMQIIDPSRVPALNTQCPCHLFAEMTGRLCLVLLLFWYDCCRAPSQVVRSQR